MDQINPLDSDALMELGRATTAYHDAPPEGLDDARLAYEEALRQFQSASR